MNQYKLKDMVRGWFVGQFSPTTFATGACEVAVKQYKGGDIEAAHYHSIATEITVVISGKIRIANREFGDGDIVVLKPGEIASFEAITDSVNVVVKIPGALNDKFFIGESPKQNCNGDTKA